MDFKIVCFYLFTCFSCFSACTQHIPEEVKKDYASQFQSVFALQSEGMSISSMTYFEDAYMKALKAGEPVRKLEALRRLFVWYRTYGYYLKLIKKDPKIFGQYLGNGQYSSYSRSERSLSPALTRKDKDSERDAKIRDFLFGVTEVVSGLVCFYVGPPPWKYAGPFMVIEGSNKVWDAINSIWLIDSITRSQFEIVKEELKVASE